jgi:hypothetical protein
MWSDVAQEARNSRSALSAEERAFIDYLDNTWLPWAESAPRRPYDAGQSTPMVSYQRAPSDLVSLGKRMSPHFHQYERVPACPLMPSPAGGQMSVLAREAMSEVAANQLRDDIINTLTQRQDVSVADLCHLLAGVYIGIGALVKEDVGERFAILDSVNMNNRPEHYTGVRQDFI